MTFRKNPEDGTGSCRKQKGRGPTLRIRAWSDRLLAQRAEAGHIRKDIRTRDRKWKT